MVKYADLVRQYQENERAAAIAVSKASASRAAMIARHPTVLVHFVYDDSTDEWGIGPRAPEEYRVVWIDDRFLTICSLGEDYRYELTGGYCVTGGSYIEREDIKQVIAAFAELAKDVEEKQ